METSHDMYVNRIYSLVHWSTLNNLLFQIINLIFLSMVSFLSFFLVLYVPTTCTKYKKKMLKKLKKTSISLLHFIGLRFSMFLLHKDRFNFSAIKEKVIGYKIFIFICNYINLFGRKHQVSLIRTSKLSCHHYAIFASVKTCLLV